MPKRFIELQYLSPVGDYNLSGKHLVNILVLINTTYSGQVVIREVRDISMSSVTKKTRGHPIAQTVEFDDTLESPVVACKLFQWDSSCNKLHILFVGVLDIRERGKITTVMKGVPDNNHIVCDGKNKGDYLWEFFDSLNYDKFGAYCVLMTEDRVVYNPRFQCPDQRYPCDNEGGPCPGLRYPLLKTVFRSDIKNSSYVYNRYSRTVFKEWFPVNNVLAIDNGVQGYFKKIVNRRDQLCKYRNSCDRFIKDFRVDITKSSNSNFTCTDRLSRRKIVPYHRPAATHRYDTNLFICPSDGRVIGFDTFSKNSEIVHNRKLDVLPYIERSVKGIKSVVNGSGFIVRVSATDYHRIYLPYSGSLVKMCPFTVGKKHLGTVLKLENEYYMAPHVKERDQWSIAYGKCLGPNRGCSERLPPQEDTKLEFYVFLIGSTLKIDSMDHLMKSNDNNWLEKGEDIGSFGFGESMIVVLCNRKIDFSSDIHYYSNTGSDTKDCPLETYVHGRDLVGLLK